MRGAKGGTMRYEKANLGDGVKLHAVYRLLDKGHYAGGTEAPWYQSWDIAEPERARFREIAIRAQAAKALAMEGQGPDPVHCVNQPKLKPEILMPLLPDNGLRTLSLFSGGGGLDLGFERAGFVHFASYEIVTDAAETIATNRPTWRVYSGREGDVRDRSWSQFSGEVDIVHGGPPCQPFSSAGRQRGGADERNLFPEFIRAVREIRPSAFVAENVRALMNTKFASFVRREILGPLMDCGYSVRVLELALPTFGVPQVRNRVFFVGIRQDMRHDFRVPGPTHSAHFDYRRSELSDSLFGDLEPVNPLPRCMGAREALGLPDVGFDGLAPTIRSGLTGPRHTTSILSSVSALRSWNQLQIWPNGVAKNREEAIRFIPQNRHFRLSVADCALLQGFPGDWRFVGPVYMAIGQIGNSVSPVMAYQVAQALAAALR